MKNRTYQIAGIALCIALLGGAVAVFSNNQNEETEYVAGLVPKEVHMQALRTNQTGNVEPIDHTRFIQHDPVAKEALQTFMEERERLMGELAEIFRLFKEADEEQRATIKALEEEYRKELRRVRKRYSATLLHRYDQMVYGEGMPPLEEYLRRSEGGL